MRSFSLFFLINLFFFIPHNTTGQSTTPVDSLIKKFGAAKAHPSEQIYVHINKHHFAPGEDLWFKLYAVNPMDLKPGGISKLVYVELINPEGQVIDKRNIHITDGLGNGDITLPDTLTSGNYFLRAYTRFMLNEGQPEEFFEAIRISDYSVSATEKIEPIGKFEIDFFPEGGNMVNDLPCQVAFKATLPDGLGAAVTGTLYDQNHKPLVDFESNQFGYGSFFIKPENGNRYYANVRYDSISKTKYLPEALNSGYLLQVRSSPDEITVIVQTKNRSLKRCKLIFYTENEFLGFLNPQVSENHMVSTISTKELPSGIIYFTLFDENNIPQCERLAYVLPPENHTAIRTDKQIYQKRKKVIVKIDTPGDTSYASAAVVNKLVSHSGGHNIRTYLNLTSNLLGYIQNPMWYFEKQSRDRYTALDLVLLTHGWRKFNWKVLTEKPSEYDFSSEQGFTIGGQLVDFYNRKKPVQGEVTISLLENPMYHATVTTGPMGRFVFADSHFPDTVTVIIQAKKLNKRQSNNILIRMNNTFWNELSGDKKKTPITTIPNYRSSEKNEADSSTLYLQDQDQKITSILEAFEGKTIILDEFAFSSTRSRIDEMPTIYGKPTHRYDMDSLPADPRNGAVDMMQLIANLNIPSLNLSTLTMRGISSIDAGNTVLFLVDGVQMQPTEEGEKRNFLNFLSPSEIARVDVLTGANASMYGARGSNGVIAIYTREAGPVSKTTSRMGIIDFTHPGYYQARTFYAPRYDGFEETTEKPDFRHTLHWEPNLITNDKGEAEFDFFTSDEVGDYQIELQGITNAGKPFYQTEVIRTE